METEFQSTSMSELLTLPEDEFRTTIFWMFTELRKSLKTPLIYLKKVRGEIKIIN